MAGIIEWIKSIVIIVLFASFFELLLPASGMQRFIRVIMSLLIMLAVLNPVVEFIQSGFTFGHEPVLSVSGGNSSERVHDSTEQMLQARNQLTTETYKKELEKQIKAVVLAVDGVADARVAIDVNKTPDGRVDGVGNIKIYVKPGISQPKGSVDAVSIGVGNEPKQEEITPSQKEKIRRTIRELFQMKDAQIEINAMN